MFPKLRSALRFWILVALVQGFVLGTIFALALLGIRARLSSGTPDGTRRDGPLWTYITMGGVAVIVTLLLIFGIGALITGLTGRHIEAVGWQELGGRPTLPKRRQGQRTSWDR